MGDTAAIAAPAVAAAAAALLPPSEEVRPRKRGVAAAVTMSTATYSLQRGCAKGVHGGGPGGTEGTHSAACPCGMAMWHGHVAWAQLALLLHPAPLSAAAALAISSAGARPARLCCHQACSAPPPATHRLQAAYTVVPPATARLCGASGSAASRSGTNSSPSYLYSSSLHRGQASRVRGVYRGTASR